MSQEFPPVTENLKVRDSYAQFIRERNRQEKLVNRVFLIFCVAFTCLAWFIVYKLIRG